MFMWTIDNVVYIFFVIIVCVCVFDLCVYVCLVSKKETADTASLSYWSPDEVIINGKMDAANYSAYSGYAHLGAGAWGSLGVTENRLGF